MKAENDRRDEKGKYKKKKKDNKRTKYRVSFCAAVKMKRRNMKLINYIVNDKSKTF